MDAGVRIGRALVSEQVGDGLRAASAGWSFGGEVPAAFDAHARRSIPYYEDGHRLVERLSDHFLHSGSLCYDVGCSCGTLLGRLAERHPEGCGFVGIDAEPGMARLARASLAGRPNVTVIEADACDFAFEAADLVILYYTAQFVRPKRRQALIDAVYRALNWGGALLMFEKVRGPDARFQDIASQLYTDMKTENGFSADEILAKSRSLKGVLEPFSTQGNLDLLARAGFHDCMTMFKYVCFEGYLAIK